jgi:hypothetical protein
MALVQLLYLSSMVVDSREALLQILKVANINNKRRQITGMLLYSEGNILQVIEGETEPLYDTFASIEADTRHHGIIVLLEKEIETRSFSDWSLGFRQISPTDVEMFPEIAPVFDMGNKQFPVRIQPCEAVVVMQSFARNLPQASTNHNMQSSMSR